MWPESAPRRSWARRFAGLAVSAALHGLLFFVVITGRLPELPERRITLIPIPVPQDERAEEMPIYRPDRRQQPAGPVRQVPATPLLVPTVIDTSRPLPLVVTRPVDTLAPARRARAGRIGPAPGDGRLWVRVLPLPPRDLAARLAPSHIELVDSAVTAIVQGYLDSIAREPGADRVPLPDWTTEIDGKKFGLDSRNIYVAGLKIPAVVLALLPLPSGGNQLSALDHNGQWIAEDLRRAASRAATLEDFKRAVRELRQEKQRQKDLERAQRERPDSTPAQD
ncbi:MAG: hypothetical protein SF070_13350 [Gemmatimonadota bacterium]|nr:hypothetical protein [Gemmatimonadota bacterium]